MSDSDDYGYFDEFEDYEPEELQPLPRDTKIDEAKEVFMEDLFDRNAHEVYYERQIEVKYERKFFHWISAKALKELVKENAINTSLLHLQNNVPIRFYWSRQNQNLNRYWKRQAQRVRKIVQSFSTNEVTDLLGHTGETLFDQAMPWFGFMPIAKNARSYGGKTWTQTGDNLDRIFVKDGIAYGTEIKNTLRYIPRDEMERKTAMCQFLEIRPLFIVRMAPASYIYETLQNGGFTIVFEYHLYPLSHLKLAQQISSVLGIKADAPPSLREGTVKRLLKNHECYRRLRNHD